MQKNQYTVPQKKQFLSTAEFLSHVFKTKYLLAKQISNIKLNDNLCKTKSRYCKNYFRIKYFNFLWSRKQNCHCQAKYINKVYKVYK